jgi:hypothetical protein
MLSSFLKDRNLNMLAFKRVLLALERHPGVTEATLE